MRIRKRIADHGTVPPRHTEALAVFAQQTRLRKGFAGGLFCLLVVALALGGSSEMGAQAKAYAEPGAPATLTIIYVTDQAGQPLQGAEVYRNGATCTLLGTTNQYGKLVIDANVGEQIAVRKLVYTGPSYKGGHNSWAYHVWLTNVKQQFDGSQTFDVISTPGGTHQLYVYRSEAQIGFNILAGVEYNASPSNLADIANGFRRASQYLFDATNGQCFLSKSISTRTVRTFQMLTTSSMPILLPGRRRWVSVRASPRCRLRTSACLALVLRVRGANLAASAP